MENALMMHRQGDVLFVKVADLPPERVERKSDVLVEGEATGHAHRLTAGQIWQTRSGLLYLLSSQANRYLPDPERLRWSWFALVPVGKSGVIASFCAFCTLSHQ